MIRTDLDPIHEMVLRDDVTGIAMEASQNSLIVFVAELELWRVWEIRLADDEDGLSCQFDDPALLCIDAARKLKSELPGIIARYAYGLTAHHQMRIIAQFESEIMDELEFDAAARIITRAGDEL